MRILRSTWMAAALALLGAAGAAAQTVRGTVVDAATGQPVPEATVSALDERGRSVARMRTGADGWFQLSITDPGQYRLQATRIGYQTSTSAPVEVGLRETLEVDLKLSTAALEIDPVTVTARKQPPRLPGLESAGFYDRERQGNGKFFTRTEIEEQRPMELSEVLRRAPGVSTVPGRGTKNYVVMTRSGQRCLPRVFIDGSPMGQGLIDEMVEPEHVEGVEVYRGAAEAPAQFSGVGGSCGVILIWTRSGR